MKKLIFCLVVIVGIQFSCSNDFDLIDDWKDITIVYGLLNQNDDTHYIRIEKAFLDPTTSALVLAQNADSIYYNNISVSLEEWNNGTVNETFTLTRVDGNDEGFPREEGIFVTTPNYLYKTDVDLDEDKTYRLVINKGGGADDIVEASTDITGEVNYVVPLVDIPLRLDYAREFDVRWFGDEKSQIYDFTIRFRYTEAPFDNQANVTNKTLDWVRFKNLAPDEANKVDFKMRGDEFYKFLENNIAVEPSTIRKLQGIDFVIDAGGLTLKRYIDAGTVNTGIASGQNIPEYTNVSDGGRGVFSSRYSQTIENFVLQGESKDSLYYGIYTSDLNFRP